MYHSFCHFADASVTVVAFSVWNNFWMKGYQHEKHQMDSTIYEWVKVTTQNDMGQQTSKRKRWTQIAQMVAQIKRMETLGRERGR